MREWEDEEVSVEEFHAESLRLRVFVPAHDAPFAATWFTNFAFRLAGFNHETDSCRRAVFALIRDARAAMRRQIVAAS